MISIMDFYIWLNGQMKKAGLNQSQLAKRSNLNQAAISRLLSGQASPSPDTCQAFARVFHMPVEEVYRAAGLLPTKPEADEIIERADHIIGSYKYPETKERALAYLEFLRVEEEKGEYRAKPAQHPAPSKP